MKTTRDIRSSLELGRKQTVPSRTRFIEAKIRKELEEELGEILDDDESAELVEREERRSEAHDLALKNAKLKILKAKEKARTMQEGRNSQETRTRKSRVWRAKVNATKTKAKPSEKRKFNEISFEY